MDCTIDELIPADWERVREIYLEGIATGHSTFEAGAPDWPGWSAKHLPQPRLVARVEGVVSAWAALIQVSDRPVYRSGVAGRE